MGSRGEADEVDESDDAGRLLSLLEAEVGHAARAWAPVARVAPDTVSAALGWLAQPRRRGALEPGHRALILLAVDASSTHRDEESVRAHVADALGAGASEADILEVGELASIVGMHTFTFGIPLVDQVVREVVGAEAVVGDPERVASLRADRLGGRYWGEFDEELGDFTDAMLRLDPDMFEAYLDYTSRSWQQGSLPPWFKELVYVALDVVAEHQYAPGARLHMRNALRFGATPEQLVEVLELVSRQGFQALTLTGRALDEVRGR
jgi:alkylhydroperoxidase/carboxymuconolactone decarboxylase family protein YurZ